MSDAAFAPGFRSLEREVVDCRPPVEGDLPDWLSGTLLRNGPGKFEAGGERVAHWFDGLAMLRRYEFEAGELRYTNRFLRTDAYAEAAAGEPTGGFATAESGLAKLWGWLRRLGPPEPTDNANVHVARVDGAHLALTEVPRWVRFDPATLDARGEVAFDDDLNLDTTTAHLTPDPAGDGYLGFGLRFGRPRPHEYVVYRVPDETPVRREELARIETAAPAYVHDCAATERYVVLAETPLRIAVARALSPFTEGFFDMLDWRPEAGARVLLVDRATGEVTAAPAPEQFCFHAVNAYRDGDAVVLDLVDFEDDAIVDGLSFETLETEGFDGVPPGRLARYRVPLDGSPVSRERLYDGGTELPTVARGRRGRSHRYVYGQATDREGANGLVKVDTETGRAREWWARDCYVEEPRVVPRPGGDAEDDGVVLAPVLDVDAERTDLVVFDAATLTERARARLPHHHPFGFHGRFYPAD